MLSSTKTVVALNGFLGRSTDWSLIKDLLPKDWNLHAIDLWTSNLTPGFANFDEWATHFTNQIASEVSGTKILLGYSMGGRLAFNALVRSPVLFQGAMIVSANPGLLTEGERSLRIESDEVWAAKFSKEPWSEVVGQWNSQSVLRGPKILRGDSIELVRNENEFDRRTLANALRTWSLGKQRDLRAEVDRLPIPVEFVTGQDDVKFTALIREWMKQPATGERAHQVVPNSGHRVPWDAPAQFRAILAKFLSRW